MQKVRDARQRVKHALLAATAALAFAATAGGYVFAQTQASVDALKPGAAVKLYSAPDTKSSSVDADAKSLPLPIAGASQKGFYPVKIGQTTYWADGMAVKIVRNVQARCSQSAGVQAAGTLGAAANRCGN
ncbi:hypothetical protein B0G80_8174 [Paraburkholderia sp. BL6669N2]|uniref:hypothetical protein n=1 Tax=Paraburkholderia sp. BL6669N2 TaxID=1938807 RepID=UPI000E2242B7|nr:hypothetical protein [Paraburkholderia sp. BL6669N2]REG51672.1 hypothetical protein B0G80_8174 [Paraburkholderia sp. BL6669N2]